MKMNWWIKFGCFLTGWNSKILSECTEASFTHIKKYTSALLILIMIWGLTGFCFAYRYIQLPWWGCLPISLAFITLVIQIERQIILASKSKTAVVVRVLIAFIMATLGSTIIDQTMFGKDINKQMTNNIEAQVRILLPQRMTVIDDKLSTLHYAIDSLEAITASLQDEVNKKPILDQVSVSSTTDKRQDANGNWISVPVTTRNTVQIANPKYESIKSNNNMLAQLRKQEQQWSDKKQTVEQETRAELRDNVGFLEELEAMASIITSRPIAGVFYCILFSFLMCLELFVAVSKFLDAPCDYEQVVRRQLMSRIHQMDSIMQKPIQLAS